VIKYKMIGNKVAVGCINEGLEILGIMESNFLK
jgi:hypothetical protein